MDISSKPLADGTNDIELECPSCKSKVMKNALYCGRCGFSISKNNMYPPSPEMPDSTPTRESVWLWISPAIKLWIFLLMATGVIGLTGRLLKITSPFLDLSIQITTAIVILTTCIGSRRQLGALFTNFQFFRIRSVFELSAALFIMYLFMFFYMKIASLVGIDTMALLNKYDSHNWPLWSAFIVICLLPGIFEELAFRGYILNKLEKIGNQKEALIIQSAMFSVLHLLPAIFISHFVLGLILGFSRVRSQSIYPGIVHHITWNAVVIIEEYYSTGLGL